MTCMPLKVEVPPLAPSTAIMTGFREAATFEVVTCLNEIQSTRLKELANGMTKDVLLDSNQKGYKSDRKARKTVHKAQSNKIKEMTKTLDLAAQCVKSKSPILVASFSPFIGLVALTP
ncbi:hypothetical protein F2Q69_00046188 [Brassica cretica]|uniref:Uncharacterized protein n=1 Tax=Brassica cretica TaxID=69181 RepID=A0A8S9PR07_BRACR|nr:hypothetical protein F2Q69_00046188 [Brassica cretica]